MTVDLVLGAVEFDAPLASPSPNGLFSAVTWVQDGGPDARWMGEGVRIRPHNYGGEDATGIWDAPWCGEPGSDSGGAQLKEGERPDIADPFQSVTVWAYDDCDPTPLGRDEIRLRAMQNLRLREQVMAETVLAQRLLADAAAVVVARDDLRDSLSYLEGQLALTGTLGVVHSTPEHAAQEWGLVVGNGPAFRTPLSHRWVFGGGYVTALGSTLVATSPLFGWRNDVTLRETFDSEHDRWIAIAERSMVVGYERLIAAVTIPGIYSDADLTVDLVGNIDGGTP